MGLLSPTRKIYAETDLPRVLTGSKSGTGVSRAARCPTSSLRLPCQRLAVPFARQSPRNPTMRSRRAGDIRTGRYTPMMRTTLVQRRYGAVS